MDPDEPDHPQPGATELGDGRYGVTLDVPPGWNVQRKDGVLSTFRVDVPSASPQSKLRGVASLNYNPYPYSTFAGAAMYYSVLSRSTAAHCAAQVSRGTVRAQPDLMVAHMTFKHGHDEHGVICTEARDDVFTTMRGRTCLRFDLVVNTFCSQTSGAMDLTPKQLGDVNSRLAGILRSITLGR